MMLFITWAIVTACFLVLTRILHPLVLFRRHRYIRQKSAIRDKRHSSEKKRACDRRTRPKPPWVLKEVIHLQAMYPRKGCRAISYLFNRLYEHDKHITVSKSWVYEKLRQHRYAVTVERRRIHNKPAKNWPKNQLWQIDLTQIPDVNGEPIRILGCIDTGTRTCVGLQQAERKTSIALLTQVLRLCRTYGMPKVIQTDNEACFTSLFFRLGLRLAQIKHKTSDVASPWQNGRIERFFGTFKYHARQVRLQHADIDMNLQLFRLFYNSVRPHSNLDGKTPTEAWTQKNHNAKVRGYFVSEWDGVLEGIYLPP